MRRLRTPIAIGAIAALLASSSALGYAPARSFGGAGASIPASDYDALRVRSELGLEADPSVVAEIALTHESSRVFGLPLTPDEESLLLERGRIQEELGGLRMFRWENRDLWGGLWLSYPPGGTIEHALTVNVSVTRQSGDRIPEIESLVPRGADLKLHAAVFTQDALDAVHVAIVNDLDFFKALGTSFYSADTVLKDNVVEIIIPSEDRHVQAAIVDHFGGAMVRVRAGGPPIPDACSRSNCGPPWVGGLKIYRGNPNAATCTSNFIVRKFSVIWNYAMWTSGHCGSGTWRQGGSTGTVIGTTSSENYFYNMSDADIQVIQFAAQYADDDSWTARRSAPNATSSTSGRRSARTAMKWAR